MKLCDFLKEDIDVDIESSLTDDWMIAFVGPVKLTEAGEKKFAPILNNEVHFIYNDQAQVVVETEKEDNLARKLFYYAAGYCPCETYDKLFIE